MDAQYICAEQTSLTGGTAAGRALQQPDPRSGFVREHSFHLRKFQGNSLLGLWCKKWARLKAILRVYTLPPPLCWSVPGLPHDPQRMPTTHRLLGRPFCCPERAQEHTLTHFSINHSDVTNQYLIINNLLSKIMPLQVSFQ